MTTRDALRPFPRRLATALALAAPLWSAACQQPRPAVIIDNVRTLAFSRGACQAAEAFLAENRDRIAQAGCDKVAACPALTATRAACTGGRRDPGRTRDYVARLRRAFAANPACAGVLVVDGGTDTTTITAEQARLQRQPYWALAIDHTPGRDDNDWTLTDLSASGRSGHGAPDAIAASACRIARRLSP